MGPVYNIPNLWSIGGLTAQICMYRGCVGAFANYCKIMEFFTRNSGWLGWAMVLGSFQCWGILLLLHIVGQGPAVLAAGVGRVGYIFYIFHLSSLSNVLSFGRRLNMTEILWFWLLNPNSSCQLLLRMYSLSTG